MSAPMSNYSQRDNPNNTKLKTLKADKHQIHNTKYITPKTSKKHTWRLHRTLLLAGL